jgi:glycosyltransferase involved in cell wall biosynthesis
MLTMKILHVNSNDRYGGAAVTAFSLMNELNKIENIEADLLVRDKYTESINVIQTNALVRYSAKLLSYISQLIFKNSKLQHYSLPVGTTKLSDITKNGDYDVVHLHWINACFIDINDLIRIEKPIVWTLHDMWPLTLWSHITETQPTVISQIFTEPRLLKLKKLNDEKKLTIVCPSEHLALKADEFGWKNIKVIRNQFPELNSVDRSLVKPHKFPNDIQSIGAIVAGGSLDENKGIQDILYTAQRHPGLNFHILGAEPELSSNNIKTYPFTSSKHNIYKFLSDMDYLFIPSRYENLPSVAIESIQLGTPIIGYKFNPGVREIITKTNFGKLISQKDDFVAANLNDQTSHKKIDLSLLHDCLNSYKRHIDLYRSLIND